MNDLVSIIMPSYNAEKYIKSAIHSILRQTYASWELIIVDDCSRDNTVDIIRNFDDSRIRLFKNKKNSGAAISRNKALREAKGKYIAFLDSDDIWAPTKLEEQLAFMKKKGYAFTYTDYRIQLNGEWLPYICTGPNKVNKRKMYDYCYFSTITVIYDLVIEVGTHPVSNIKTAEAVKVVENSQRDINIAFMNELAMVFDRMGIDTNEVVDGMNTKWNALGFRPGLVGGHCIGVDPYYFTYEAEKLGYHSQIILNGRIVNDSMGAYVADAAFKQMIAAGQAPKKSKVVILGLTFKENCPDTRNSKVADIIKQLKTYGIDPVVVDPWASERDAMHEYGVTLTKLKDVKDADCVIVAVAHNEFKALGLDDIKKLYKDGANDEKVLLDVKGLYKVSDLEASGMRWWRL